jgi:hypothetical protein
VTDVITLKDRDGCPLSGLPNPLKTALTEFGLDGRGKHLSSDLNGIDPEGLVILSDDPSGLRKRTAHRWHISVLMVE